MQTKRIALFNIGDQVVHSQQAYRAIIIDVDPVFFASGRFNPKAVERDFAKRHPWYRVLVDGTSSICYVEEPFLSLDRSELEVENPLLLEYLVKKEGQYYSLRAPN